MRGGVKKQMRRLLYHNSIRCWVVAVSNTSNDVRVRGEDEVRKSRLSCWI